jgi:hypothetical protein
MVTVPEKSKEGKTQNGSCATRQLRKMESSREVSPEMKGTFNCSTFHD